MKLLFIAPSAYLLGGVQDWLYLLTIGLREKGHEVIVAVPQDNHHKGNVYNHFYKGLKAIVFSNKTGTHEGRIRSISQVLLNNPVDIVVGVNIGDLYVAFARVKMKLGSTRLAMTLHAIEGAYYGDIGRYQSMIDAVITTNRLSEKIIRYLHLIDENRIFYAPYGVKTEIKVEEDTHDNMLAIAWVGRIDQEQKRVLDLIEIIRILEAKKISFRMSIAGDGPNLSAVKQRMDHWIRVGRISFAGFISKENLSKFYSDHNVLLITSEWETGPIVAWEAMTSGLAVVSSKYIGSKAEAALIEGKTALLYSIGATEEAAMQIIRLSNLKLRNRIAKQGREMALLRYSRDACLEKWEEVFKIMISRRTKTFRNQIGLGSTSSGRLDSMLGSDLAEILRVNLKRKGLCPNPGSEWPHSIYEYTNQKTLLSYAQSLDKDA